MDDQRFDRLARALAQPRTRRWTLGAIAASLGVVRRSRPAAAYDYCGVFGDRFVGCGPNCTGTGHPGECHCYDPEYGYCFDEALAATCSYTMVCCYDRGGVTAVYPTGPNTCCPSGNWCDHDCCADDQLCAGAHGCKDKCPHGDFCGPEYGCCAEGQSCIDDVCQVPDSCNPERRGRAASDAGICCNPATETACGDKCCSKEDQCCGGGENTACCPKNKTCCPGPHGSACCDATESYCCSGTCCAKHWVCDAGECRAQCLGGKTNCGKNCCTKDQICSDPSQGICSLKCPVDTTSCGKQCCESNQRCVDGKCVKKKRRANHKKKHGRH